MRETRAVAAPPAPRPPTTAPPPATAASHAATTPPVPAPPMLDAPSRRKQRELRERHSFLQTEHPEEPAREGARGTLNRLGFRLRPSAAEHATRDDEIAVSQHWAGPRTIAVVNGKGGAGKTPTTIKFYRLIIDSGNDESDPMWLRMIDMPISSSSPRPCEMTTPRPARCGWRRSRITTIALHDLPSSPWSSCPRPTRRQRPPMSSTSSADTAPSLATS